MGGHRGRRDRPAGNGARDIADPLGRTMANINPACERCGGPTRYMGNVTAPIQSPIQSIYECPECGRQTWIKLSAAQQEQQPKTYDNPMSPEHKAMNSNPLCERCGGPTHYEGNVTSPNQTIYGCAKCGRHTWVKHTGQQQQQTQPENKPK